MNIWAAISLVIFAYLLGIKTGYMIGTDKKFDYKTNKETN